jgi:hypothetical protein
MYLYHLINNNKHQGRYYIRKHVEVRKMIMTTMREARYLQTGFEVSYSIYGLNNEELEAHDVEFLVNASSMGEALMKVENYINETPYTFSDGQPWSLANTNSVTISYPYAEPDYALTMENMVEHDIPVVVSRLYDSKLDVEVVNILRY